MDGASGSLYLSIQKNTLETPGGGQHEPENQYTETIFLTDHHPLNRSKRTPVICNYKLTFPISINCKCCFSHFLLLYAYNNLVLLGNYRNMELKLR